MKRTLPEVIVDFLQFSNSAVYVADHFTRFSSSEWQHALWWLDYTGLALYFLQKVRDLNVTHCVPIFTLQCLEANLAANGRRAAYMQQRFCALNRKFNDAGVRYAGVKGLTLIPQFCPDPSLRHQNDFDYLVDERSLPKAKAALEKMGYFLVKQSNWGCAYATTLHKGAAADHELYDPNAPHAVELHLTLCEGQDLLLAEPRFLDNTVVKTLGDVPFRTLPDEHAFLLQSLHAFYHILGSGWLRLSWFFEIAYFLGMRQADRPFWDGLAREMAADSSLREIVALVSKLTTDFFPVSVSSPIREWQAEIRAPVRVWIDNYAREWVLGRKRLDEFTFLSTRKLPLFLYQQYLASAVGLGILRQLFPTARLYRVAHAITTKPAAALRPEFRRRERILRRSMFHLGADLRYIWEIPRWKWLNMRYESTVVPGGRSAGRRIDDKPGTDSPILTGPPS